MIFWGKNFVHQTNTSGGLTSGLKICTVISALGIPARSIFSKISLHGGLDNLTVPLRNKSGVRYSTYRCMSGTGRSCSPRVPAPPSGSGQPAPWWETGTAPDTQQQINHQHVFFQIITINRYLNQCCGSEIIFFESGSDFSGNFGSGSDFGSDLIYQ